MNETLQRHQLILPRMHLQKLEEFLADKDNASSILHKFSDIKGLGIVLDRELSLILEKRKEAIGTVQKLYAISLNPSEQDVLLAGQVRIMLIKSKVSRL